MYIQVPKIFWTFWKKEKNSWNFREELEHYTKSILHFPYTEHGLCFSCFHWYHCFLREFICSWSCAGHQGFPWEWIQGCILIQWCSTGMLLCWLEDFSGQMVLFNPVSALSLCLPPSLPPPSLCLPHNVCMNFTVFCLHIYTEVFLLLFSCRRHWRSFDLFPRCCYAAPPAGGHTVLP